VPNIPIVTLITGMFEATAWSIARCTHPLPLDDSVVTGMNRVGVCDERLDLVVKARTYLESPVPLQAERRWLIASRVFDRWVRAQTRSCPGDLQRQRKILRQIASVK
jgi:hypothetical protein